MEEWLTRAMATVVSSEETRAFVDEMSLECGFVVVRPTDFEHRMSHEGSIAGVRRIAVLQGLLEAFAPKGIRREGTLLVAVTDTGEQALHLALTLSQFKEAHPVSIAVGFGRVLMGPHMELFGQSIDQARRLVAWARPHELLIPKALLNDLTLPQGVGVFAAPELLEEELHFPCSILRDFRMAVPIS